jgi:TPR repeat protein
MEKDKMILGNDVGNTFMAVFLRFRDQFLNSKKGFHLGLLLLLSAPTYADDLLERTNSNLDYLRQQVINQPEKGLIDIPASERVIGELSQVLDGYELELHDQILLRTVRALSLKNINMLRLNSLQKVDLAQAELAIADIDFVSKKSDSVDLLYAAGHISMHLLDYPVQAYQYWQQCAESGHAGCMNILAAHRFTGENGLSVDVEQSIYWHQQVYKTGTEYICAGVFSAIALGELAHFYSDLDTGSNWTQWLEKRDLLLDDLISKGHDENICQLGVHYARDFVLQHHLSEDNIATLDLAIKLMSEDSEKQVLEVIKQGKELSTVIPYLSSIEYPEEQCSLTLSLLLYAKYDGQQKAVQALTDYMTSLSMEYCAWEFALIERMQTSGRWH